MADMVNTSTLELLRSVNAPDYAPPWLIITRTEYDAANAIPARYRQWNGSSVVEADQATKDAIDAAILEASRDATADGLDAVESLERAYAQAALDESNLHAQRITAILDAIDSANNLADVKTAVAAIADVPTRTIAQMKTALRNKLGS